MCFDSIKQYTFECEKIEEHEYYSTYDKNCYAKNTLMNEILTASKGLPTESRTTPLMSPSCAKTIFVADNSIRRREILLNNFIVD